MRTKLFWQHGTFNAFEFLYGILYLSIYVEYWLTQLGVISMLVDGESIVPHLCGTRYWITMARY